MTKRVKADGVLSCSNSPTRMQGTFGYFAPEYAIIGRASLMSDVFSFGVVLLELIIGRQPIRKLTNKGDESLVLWTVDVDLPNTTESYRLYCQRIIASDIKECVYVHPILHMMKFSYSNIPTTSYELPDGQTLEIGADRFKILDILFNPQLAQMSNASRSIKRLICASKHTILTGPYSSLVGIDHNLCFETHCKDTDNVALEYMERLILLTSEAKSSRAPDDEIVDLTEPQFESFVAHDVSPTDSQEFICTNNS